MAGIVKRDCPYCKTRNVAFTAVEEWSAGDQTRRALFLCGACVEGVIWEWQGTSTVQQLNGLVENMGVSLGRQWPEPTLGAVPEDTPANVALYFQQGLLSLDAGSYDAAGMMFRKTLESATKILDPERADTKLVKRIDLLADQGKLTSDMADWAHEIRLGGNDAAHEDEPFTAEEAEDLRNFIENFLRYAFSLPSAVQRRAKPVEQHEG